MVFVIRLRKNRAENRKISNHVTLVCYLFSVVCSVTLFTSFKIQRICQDFVLPYLLCTINDFGL